MATELAAELIGRRVLVNNVSFELVDGTEEDSRFIFTTDQGFAEEISRVLNDNDARSYIPLTLFNPTSQGTLAPGQFEIVWAINGDVFDDEAEIRILRGREGTFPQNWPSGTLAECRYTGEASFESVPVPGAQLDVGSSLIPPFLGAEAIGQVSEAERIRLVPDIAGTRLTTWFSEPMPFNGFEVWEPNTLYFHEDIVIPPVPNGFFYIATILDARGPSSQVSGANVPLFSEFEGARVRESGQTVSSLFGDTFVQGITWETRQIKDSGTLFQAPDGTAFIPVKMGVLFNRQTGFFFSLTAPCQFVITNGDENYLFQGTLGELEDGTIGDIRGVGIWERSLRTLSHTPRGEIRFNIIGASGGEDPNYVINGRVYVTGYWVNLPFSEQAVPNTADPTTGRLAASANNGLVQDPANAFFDD